MRNYTVGQRIRDRRLELQLTLMDVAVLLGYKTKSAVSKIELKGDNIKMRDVEAFATALRCTTAYLMGWEDINGSIIEECKIAVTNEEKELIESYRNHPEFQAAIKAMLGVK